MPDRTPTPPPAADALAPSFTPASELALPVRARLAAALVAALTRAARAFTLYDPANALIRQFLSDFQARAHAATAEADVAIDVSPHELTADGSVVYREDDREKSLAFRLYRDGVRRITFVQGAPFDDLLRLLQILAVRFTGIRESEDDIVTLLRKAELSGVQIVAVEGFTAEDETEDERRPFDTFRAIAPTFDTPFPRLAAPRPIAPAAVPEEALAPLRAEVAPEGVVPGALRLAAELLAHGARGRLGPAEIAQYCIELRDFLVADRQLGALVTLAELVQRQAAGPLRDEVLRGLADPRLLDAVLAEIPPGGRELPPEAIRLLPFVPAGSILDLLAGDPGERREPLLALVAARLPADADEVLARLASVPAPVARSLAKAIGARAPARTADAAVALIAHGDESVQLDALRAVAALPGTLPAAPLLAKLASSSEAVRIAAARALERHGGAASARAVSDALATRKGLSRDEAAALGRTLGALNPAAALRQFDAWLPERRGVLSRAFRSTEHEDLLRWAAVAGLGVIPGPEAEQRLEEAASTKDEELRLHCRATLARRRAGEAHGRHG
jgi:hypothetical protein